MSIRDDVLKATTPARLELFKLDLSNIPQLGALRYYLTPSSATPITWGGNSYLPWAIKVEGLGMAGDGAPNRPTLTIGNLDANKLIGTLAFAYGDIIGATVTYIETFSTYISTSISLPPVTSVIGRKIVQTASTIQFELRSPLDKERAYLPNRQILKRDFPGLGVTKAR